MDEPNRPSEPTADGSAPDSRAPLDHDHLESLVNTVGGVVWEFDWPTGAFTFVSDGAETLLGFPKTDWLVPGFWLERLHPDDASWAPAFCQRSTSQRKDHEFSYRLIHADGSSVWVRDIVTVDPDKGVDGRLRGLIVDITAQKRAEERLATSELRFREIIEHVGVLAVQIDVTGVITFANDSAMRMFGEDQARGSVLLRAARPRCCARPQSPRSTIGSSPAGPAGPLRFPSPIATAPGGSCAGTQPTCPGLAASLPAS